jgi:hypothetical protein
MQTWLMTVPHLECGLLLYGTIWSIILQKPTASIFKLQTFTNNSLPRSMGTNTLDETAVCILNILKLWRNMLCVSSRYQHIGGTHCLQLQGTSNLEESSVCIIKTPTFWKNLLPLCSGHQHLEQSHCFHLQVINTVAVSPVRIFKAPAFWVYLQGTKI